LPVTSVRSSEFFFISYEITGTIYFISGVFALVIAYSTLKYTQSFLTKAEFKYFFLVAAVSAAGLIFSSVVGLTWAGECIYVFYS